MNCWRKNSPSSSSTTNPQEAEAIPALKNYFKAYATSDQIRHIIESRQFTDLATALFDIEGEYLFASFLLGIRPHRELLNSRYLWHTLNIYRREGRYIHLMRQNVNGLFNCEELKVTKIPLPPLATQQAIVAEIESEQALVAANRELIERFEKKIQAINARYEPPRSHR